MHRYFLPRAGLVGIALLALAGATLGDDAARTAGPALADTAAVNPKVQPGKVRWHASFAAACAAARKSAKPVLLFQLMGKLDEQFC